MSSFLPLHSRHYLFMILIASLIIASDQWTKNAILDYFAHKPLGSHVALTSFFNLVLVWNTGMSFGLFHDQPWASTVFTYLPIIIASIVFIWAIRTNDTLQAYGLILIVSGAIGNIIDRFRFGSVVDFIDWYIGTWHWPAFNIADSSVCIGVAILMILSFRQPPTQA
jgi:signal peptidase II